MILRLNLAQEEHKSAVLEKKSIEKKLTDEIEIAKREALRLQQQRNEDEVDGNTDLALKLQLAEDELVQVSGACHPIFFLLIDLLLSMYAYYEYDVIIIMKVHLYW